MSENRRRLTAMQLAEWLEQFVFSAAQGVRAETADIIDRCLDSGSTDEMETLVNRIVMQPETRLEMLNEMAEVLEGRLNELRQHHFEMCGVLAANLRELWKIDLPAAAVRDLVSGASDADLEAMMDALADDVDTDLDDDDHPMNQVAMLATLEGDLGMVDYMLDFVIDWQIAMEMVAFRSAWESRDGEFLEDDGFGVAH